MASPLNIVGIFNTQLNDLLEKLLIMFPGDSKIKSAKMKIGILTSVSASKPVELFAMHVLAHKEKILMKEESYFLDDSEKLIEESGQKVDMNNVADIKGKWEHMSEGDKDVVWQYLGIMIKLSEKYATKVLGS